ncbi:MAG: (2Fe-2S)-binding protein [Alicyclobacillus sp.]|nr:(2Fe-2S)-binding protein [Alicyclobacillus sp.]
MTTGQRIRFRLNGRPVELVVQPHENLVEALRRGFQTYSVRESCGQGLCGCCTVYVDGRAVSGCLYLAVLVDGREVVTVEGLGSYQQLSPVQTAFVECEGFQCGFCTPGMVMMATKLLEENPNPSDEEIKHYLSGNLCRCAAYPEIIAAVKRAAALLQDKTSAHDAHSQQTPVRA